MTLSAPGRTCPGLLAIFAAACWGPPAGAPAEVPDADTEPPTAPSEAGGTAAPRAASQAPAPAVASAGHGAGGAEVAAAARPPLSDSTSLRQRLSVIEAATDAALDAALMADAPALAIRASSPREFDAWRLEARGALAEILGDAITTGTLDPAPQWMIPPAEHEGLMRGVIEYRLDASISTIATVTMPTGDEVHPLLMLWHGHAERPLEDLRDPLTQRFAEESLAAAGFVVVRPLLRGFSYADRTLHRHTHLAEAEVALGRPLMASYVRDARTALDAALDLQRRGELELDPEDIAAAGHSLGGAIALFSSVMDTRIDRTIVENYAGDYRWALRAVRHCICSVPTEVVARFNPVDVMALLAPRPLLVLFSTTDTYYPVTAPSEYVRPLRTAYALAGDQDALSIQTFVGEHQWVTEPALAWLTAADASRAPLDAGDATR